MQLQGSADCRLFADTPTSSALVFDAPLLRRYYPAFHRLREEAGRPTREWERLGQRGEKGKQQNADIAQLAEQVIRNDQVVGSNPTIGSRQMVDAALAGLAMGEVITIPSLPDVADRKSSTPRVAPTPNEDHAADPYDLAERAQK